MVFDLAPKEVQFFAPKKLETLSLREFRQISVGKKNRQIVVSNVSSPVKLKRKRWKKEAYFVLKYRRKTICARNIRGFLFIRKNSCSRLRFGNSFRYSKQKKRRKNFVKSKKIRKKYQFSAPPVYETSCFRSPCFTLRVFINLW